MTPRSVLSIAPVGPLLMAVLAPPRQPARPLPGQPSAPRVAKGLVDAPNLRTAATATHEALQQGRITVVRGDGDPLGQRALAPNRAER